MKKSLLFGSALFVTVSAFSQSTFHKNVSPEMLAAIKNRYAVHEPSATQLSAVPNEPTAPKIQAKSSSSSNFTWNHISRSMNFFGVLTAEQKCLQYNEDLDAVSFIQRKSPNYVATNPVPDPGAESGVMVAMITSDWGATWDSTCIWNRNDFWARYPQGAIYNPMGNTNISNAYVVATGPVTTPAPQLWVGNFYASKKLDVFTNSPDQNPLAQQMLYSSPVDTTIFEKVDFARQELSIGDDGIVRAMGGIYDAVNPSFTGFRGGRIVKGQFVSGYFNWTSDSVSLVGQPVDFDGSDFNAWPAVNMAWNEAGTIGYAWFYAIRQGADSNEVGLQPMVFKSSNGGPWNLQPTMDFNDTIKWAPVLNPLSRAESSVSAERSFRIPMFYPFGEDIAGVVDKNDDLHIVSVVYSTKSARPDSLAIRATYQNADGEKYWFPYEPGRMPYIYDFRLKSSGTSATSPSWDVMIVDSMDTEGPSTTQCATCYGYNSNPWQLYETSKQQSNARFQVSRDPAGEYLLYNWAESNIAFTDGGFRWNSRPDIHVRLRHVDSASTHEMEFNITEGTNVDGKAWLHHSSPKSKITKSVQTTSTGSLITVTARLPVKISFSSAMKPELAADHHFTAAEMTFSTAVTTIGLKENLLNANSNIFPNPAKDKAVILLNVTKSSTMKVEVMNTVGQVVRTANTTVNAGENQYEVDVKGLATGIYFVNLKVDGAKATKKLIIE